MNDISLLPVSGHDLDLTYKSTVSKSPWSQNKGVCSSPDFQLVASDQYVQTF